MALPANWYFGARNSLEGDQSSPFGAFNLGGIQDSPPVQSSVATPNPAAAGVSGPSAGGMSIGQQPDQSGGSLPGTVSNANVTGFDSSLASTAAQVGLAGLPGLGSLVGPAIGQAAGPIAGLIGSLASGFGQRAGTSAALGAIPNGLVDSFGNPVTYTGNTFGLPTGSLHGLNMSDVDTTPADPNNMGLPQSYNVPSVSPNMGGLFSGNGGFVSQGVGDANAGFAGSGAGGRFGFNAPGVRNPFAPYFTDPHVQDPEPIDLQFDNTQDSPPDAPGPTGPVGMPGEGMTNDGPSVSTGDSGPSGPAGDGGTGPSGDGPGGGTFRTGGRVQRPDPRRLAQMLQRGAKVNVGSKADKDSVPVRLERGEVVMNRPAARAHARQLDEWNADGRRGMGRSTGGFAIGRPRDQRR
jgi:hypothetical protein